MKIIIMSYEPDIFDYMSEIVDDVERSGFLKGIVVDVDDISVRQEVKDACKYCTSMNNNYSCPPYSFTTDRTKKILSKYSHGVLLVLKVPIYSILMRMPYISGIYKKFMILTNTRKMHNKILKLEKESRRDGHNAYGFISGKCLISLRCKCGITKCKYPALKRYSMESVGIDVFTLAKRYGIKLDYVLHNHFYYIGLLLIKQKEKKERTIEIIEFGLDELDISKLSFIGGKREETCIKNLQGKMVEKYGNGKIYLAVNEKYDECGIGMNKFIELMKSQSYEIATYGYLNPDAKYSLKHFFGDRDESKWVYLLAPPKDKETQCMQ